MRKSAAAAAIVLFSGMLFGQSPEATPRFEIADVGLEGKWNFALTFNSSSGGGAEGTRRTNAGPDGVAASEPAGATIFQALEKQLGLKLESKKRLLPVIVIDKLNQKPTEN